MASSERPGRLAGLLAPGLACVLVLALLIGLGLWQLERKSWKDGLTAQIQARAFGSPSEVPPEREWPSWRAADDEFRRVRLEGVFDHGREVLVHGLLQDRPGRPVQGFYVFTPLRRDDGSVVIVNRGFTPTPLKDESTRREGNLPGRVNVVGLIRAPETRGWFVPENGPASWFVRDVGQMSREQGLARAAPFYVDADATPHPGGWPRGGQTRILLANNHLQYAFTWFGLAGALAAVFAVFAHRRLNRSGHELQAEDPGYDQPDAAKP